MAKNTFGTGLDTVGETTEELLPGEVLIDAPGKEQGRKDAIKMIRGAVEVWVAPQDIGGFKSAGYEVIN